MYDPLRTEQAFQELSVRLAGPASARWHVQAVHDFLDRLDEIEAAAEPYVLDLVQRLPGVLHRFDPVGLAPEDVTALLRRLAQLPAACPLLDDVAEFEATLTALRTAAATLYAYAGDVQAAVATITGLEEDERLEWATALHAGDAPPLVRLERAVRAAEAHGHPAAAMLARIVEDWKARLQPVRDGTVAPVVERPLNGQSHRLHVGGLRRLRVELYGEREDADMLQADVTVFGATNNRDDLLKPSVAAARRLLAETYPALATRYVAGQVHFDAVYALHEGRSADLAVAALFYGAVLRFTQQRAQYHVAPGAALTGQLDADGTAQPVDDATLATKVRTAFFSWVRCLAVPVAQLPAAQAVLHELTDRYPHRRLDLVGIGHLREVFYDRRLTIHHQTSLPRHLARRAWQRKFSLGSLALILLLTLAVGRLLYGPLDKNPVAAEFAEEMMLVKNKYGGVVDEIWVGMRTAAQAANYPRQVAFYDIDGDSRNEVIWSQLAVGHGANYVHCKSVLEDTLRWSLEMKEKLVFPRKPEVIDENFRPVAILAGDFDRDEHPEVFVNAVHAKFFPTLLLKLDAASGARLGQYLHIGHATKSEAVDLDDDGIVEILIAGTNNAFGDATLAVLDPRLVEGHSPLRGDYQVEGYPPGLERAYLRIPKTKVARAFGYNSPQNRIRSLEIRTSDRLIASSITDVSLFNPPIDAPGNGGIYAYFAFDLSPLGFDTGSDYDQLAKMLHDQGVLDAMPDRDYFEDFKQEIMYWDGETWQHRPVLNQRYVEAKAAFEDNSKDEGSG